jgi:L-ascorbate metabolism protein UlaG (beta-lactamase superfamily)
MVFLFAVSPAHGAGRFVQIRGGTASVIDGKAEGEEWKDAVSISLGRKNGEEMRVFLKHDGVHLYVGFNVSISGFAVDVENDGGREPRPDDLRFHASHAHWEYVGAKGAKSHGGKGWSQVDATGWSATNLGRVQGRGKVWSEYRLPLAKFGIRPGTPKTMRMVFIAWDMCPGRDVVYPKNADVSVPETWISVTSPDRWFQECAPPSGEESSGDRERASGSAGLKAALKKKRIDLDLSRKSFREALSALKKSGVLATADASVGPVHRKRKIRLQCVAKPALEVLGEIAEQAGLTYDLVGDRVIFRYRAYESPADVADVPAQDLFAWGDPKMRYFLMGPRKGSRAPRKGFGIVIIMPGGSGDHRFHPFVKRIVKNSIPDGFIAVQPVAVRWDDQVDITWPTRKAAVQGMEFSTEVFVREVVSHVRSKFKIDRRRIFTFAWSSSGPPSYFMSLKRDRIITGSFIAMSVFHSAWLPPLENAAGYPYFLYHSPQDRRCRFHFARQAERELKARGAQVKMVTYEGGHRWVLPFYDDIRSGIEWLDGKAVEEVKTVIRPLGGSGFHIETPKHHVIFDPFDVFPRPEEMKEKSVIVVGSGTAEGGLSPDAVRCLGTLKNARFILPGGGVESAAPALKGVLEGLRGGRITEIDGGAKKKVNGVTVMGVKGEKGGTGVVVEVEGLLFYHGGGREVNAPGKDLPSNKKVDVAFLSLSAPSSRKVSVKAVKVLHPRIVVPFGLEGQVDSLTLFKKEIERAKGGAVRIEVLKTAEDACVVKK